MFHINIQGVYGVGFIILQALVSEKYGSVGFASRNSYMILYENHDETWNRILISPTSFF